MRARLSEPYADTRKQADTQAREPERVDFAPTGNRLGDDPVWRRLVLPVAAGVLLVVTPGVLFWQNHRHQKQLDQLMRPQVNAQVFSLRSPNGPDGNQLQLGTSPATLLLSIELPPPSYVSYQAVLKDSRGQILWQGEGLKPTPQSTLQMSVNSAFLPPGGYRLSVVGQIAGGRSEPVAEYSFTATRK